MLSNHLLIITANLLNAVVAILVFINYPNKKINRLYLLLAMSLIGWTTANEFSLLLSDPDQILIAVQWVLVFVVLQNYLYVQFTNIFPDEKPVIQKTKQIIYTSLTAVVLALALGGMFFSGYSGSGTSFSDIKLEPTPFIGLFAFHALISVSRGIWSILAKRKLSSKKKKTQLDLMLIASGILFGLVPITAFISPAIFGNNTLIFLAPVYTLMFALLIAYAMYKYQLFDIRMAIARTSAYTMLLGALLFIYVSMIFSVSLLFFDSSVLSTTELIIYALLAVFLAFTYQPLKVFFDKLTDSFFYRDKYNAEVILSDYSDFLVDEIDTDKIINRTLTLMDEIANPSTGLIVLYREGIGDWHDVNGALYGDERDELAKALEYQSDPVYVADESSVLADSFLENIKVHMNNNSLKVSIRLSTHGQLEGFILLGDKKSGTSYTQKDLGFFVTIANELSVSLQNSQRFDQIQRFNVTLQREVDEATARLKQTNLKLKQLDTAKDEFISMASHQLRTPLTSVKGYVSMVMDGDAGEVSQEQKKLLSEAFASSQRMVFLIADLLNVSRIKTGKFLMEKNKINLEKIVQEEVDQLTPTAKTRSVLINYSQPSSFPEMMLDKTKTRQVIMNFIDNAIYYTKGGGDITVTLTAKKNHIEYRVKDTGIGIPAADQHKLFTKFFRASNAKKARPDGTGLGLYMAQKIIAAQGGSVTFKSKEGKGSTFGFNLPLQKPQP